MRNGLALVALAVGAGLTSFFAAPNEARAADKTLSDYRWFRALSIDLNGRIPSRAELAEFESAAFDADAWIDAHLEGPAYAERLTRIYLDALRLELSDTFKYNQGLTTLRRYPVDVLNADSTTKRTWIYYRNGQRRAGTSADRDRGFCLTTAETGSAYKNGQIPIPEFPTKAVPIATLQQYAVKVKPWWLYRDYASASPKDHYRSWSATEPRYSLSVPADTKAPATRANDPRLLVDLDGADVDDVWICKEEAQTAPSAKTKVRGVDTDVACNADSGFRLSPSCGCGKGLEWCMPGASFNNDPPAMVTATLAPLGPEIPFETARQQQSAWFRRMWHEEGRRFFTTLFGEDRDFRDVLLAKYDWVNGPLVQFYKGMVNADCCTDMVGIGGGPKYLTPESLVDAQKLPAITPTEMDRWEKVEDRGSHAAGVLTLPIFLAKFASRRGRANAVYNTFLCREFIAENLDLKPSEEPNLMVRPGCSTCHAKLEPLAAYFTRVKENSFTFITAPLDNELCKTPAPGNALDPSCKLYYDPSFSDATSGKLRGAYASADNADKGPRGLAESVVGTPDFPACAARRVFESMLGRSTSLSSEDKLLAELNQTFIDGGFRMRPLVRAIVKSNAYRNANAVAVLGGGK